MTKKTSGADVGSAGKIRLPEGSGGFFLYRRLTARFYYCRRWKRENPPEPSGSLVPQRFLASRAGQPLPPSRARRTTSATICEGADLKQRACASAQRRPYASLLKACQFEGARMVCALQANKQKWRFVGDPVLPVTLPCKLARVLGRPVTIRGWRRPLGGLQAVNFSTGGIHHNWR
jgi:hypothetical protein